MLYGCYPSPSVSHSLPLRPALTFRTEVGDLKSLRPGESVSYGRSFVASRSTQIAVLPVGYADGYDRGLSNRSHVILRGQQAPVIGTICMDMTAVDVTDILDVGKETRWSFSAVREMWRSPQRISPRCWAPSPTRCFVPLEAG